MADEETPLVRYDRAKRSLADAERACADARLEELLAYRALPLALREQGFGTLPEELVRMIWDRVVDQAATVSFRSVCVSWYAAVPKRRRVFPGAGGGTRWSMGRLGGGLLLLPRLGRVFDLTAAGPGNDAVEPVFQIDYGGAEAGRDGYGPAANLSPTGRTLVYQRHTWPRAVEFVWHDLRAAGAEMGRVSFVSTVAKRVEAVADVAGVASFAVVQDRVHGWLWTIPHTRAHPSSILAFGGGVAVASDGDVFSIATGERLRNPFDDDARPFKLATCAEDGSVTMYTYDDREITKRRFTAGRRAEPERVSGPGGAFWHQEWTHAVTTADGRLLAFFMGNEFVVLRDLRPVARYRLSWNSFLCDDGDVSIDSARFMHVCTSDQQGDCVVWTFPVDAFMRAPFLD